MTQCYTDVLTHAHTHIVWDQRESLELTAEASRPPGPDTPPLPLTRVHVVADDAAGRFLSAAVQRHVVDTVGVELARIHSVPTVGQRSIRRDDDIAHGREVGWREVGGQWRSTVFT